MLPCIPPIQTPTATDPPDRFLLHWNCISLIHFIRSLPEIWCAGPGVWGKPSQERAVEPGAAGNPGACRRSGDHRSRCPRATYEWPERKYPLQYDQSIIVSARPTAVGEGGGYVRDFVSRRISRCVLRRGGRQWSSGAADELPASDWEGTVRARRLMDLGRGVGDG